jgi:hypothetical protein
MFRVYVQADGTMCVVMGNQRLEASADELCALIFGTLDYAKVFSKLNGQMDVTTFVGVDENSRVNGYSKGE